MVSDPPGWGGPIVPGGGGLDMGGGAGYSWAMQAIGMLFLIFGLFLVRFQGGSYL